MTVLSIVCNPSGGSFTHALADAAAEGIGRTGHQARTFDLYREEFDPVLRREEIESRFSFDPTVQRYWEAVEGAEGFVFTYPDWWGMPPALLKGWLDRVLRPGVAYDYGGEEFGEKTPLPLLTGKRGLVITTSDEMSHEQDAAVRTVWKGIFEFCGIGEWELLAFTGVRGSGFRTRSDWIAETARTAERLFGGSSPDESG